MSAFKKPSGGLSPSDRSVASPHVARTIGEGEERQEPGRAIIERQRRRRDIVEGGCALRVPENFEGGAMAEIRHERNARAVAAESVMDAVLHADRRQIGARHGDAAGPAMTDLHLCK